MIVGDPTLNTCRYRDVIYASFNLLGWLYVVNHYQLDHQFDLDDNWNCEHLE